MSFVVVAPTTARRLPCPDGCSLNMATHISVESPFVQCLDSFEATQKLLDSFNRKGDSSTTQQSQLEPHGPSSPVDFQLCFHLQELNYGFIAQAIVDLNFNGYFAHEYSMAEGHDPIATLNRALEICDV